MNALVKYIQSLLSPVYDSDEALALAWWVAEETTDKSRTELITDCKDTTFSRDMQEVVDRLLKKEPIQYIFGHCQWGDLDLKLNKSTLIPRPETAELVSYVRQVLSEQTGREQNLRVLDVGTGSGCIALSLKSSHPNWHVCGLDVSSEALDVARENGMRNSVEVEWIEADIMNQDIEEYDVIVSNPPYIAEAERDEMDINVLEYEPHSALFVEDANPLKFYNRIAEIKKAVFLFFEINPRYADMLCGKLESLGYKDIVLKKDSYGQFRFISCRLAR